MDKSTIEKVITDIIIKCGRFEGGVKSSFNNFIRRTFNEFFDETNTIDHETGLFVKDNGEILLHVEGEVTIKISDDELVKLISDNLDEIIEKKGFNFTHNHPSPYYVGNPSLGDGHFIELDDGTFTCLSSADMGFLNRTFNYGGNKYYISKSVTAECSNGTRMSLIRTNDDFNSDNFDKARDNLIKNWGNYVNDSKQATMEHLQEFGENYMKENPNAPPSDLLHEVKIKFQEEYAKKNLNNYFKGNIDEFKDVGFELSYEWTKNE